MGDTQDASHDGELDNTEETPKVKKSFFKKKPKTPKNESNPDANDEELIIDAPEEKQKRSFFSKKKKDKKDDKSVITDADGNEGEKEHKSSFFKLRKNRSSTKLDAMKDEAVVAPK